MVGVESTKALTEYSQNNKRYTCNTGILTEYSQNNTCYTCNTERLTEYLYHNGVVDIHYIHGVISTNVVISIVLILQC